MGNTSGVILQSFVKQGQLLCIHKGPAGFPHPPMRKPMKALAVQTQYGMSFVFLNFLITKQLVPDVPRNREMACLRRGTVACSCSFCRFGGSLLRGQE